MLLLVTGAGANESLFRPLELACRELGVVAASVTQTSVADALARARDPVEIFAWSSGTFAALAAAQALPYKVTRIIAFEPPFGMQRDSTPPTGQRRHFVAMLFSALVGFRRISRRHFWKLVSLHDDSTCGFDRLDAQAQRELIEASTNTPLLRQLFSTTALERAIHRPLGALDCRVLTGSLSSLAMHRAAARFSTSFGCQAAQLVDGVDHLAPVTQPAIIAAHIVSR